MTLFEVFLLFTNVGTFYLLIRTSRKPLLCSHCKELAVGHFTVNGVRTHYCNDHEHLYIEGKRNRRIPRLTK